MQLYIYIFFNLIRFYFAFSVIKWPKALNGSLWREDRQKWCICSRHTACCPQQAMTKYTAIPLLRIAIPPHVFAGRLKR